MKKYFVLLSFLFIAVAGNAQTGLSSPLTISNDTAVIDGKNNFWATYTYTGSDVTWTALFANIADNENIRVFYKKTTGSDCVIKFPDGTKFSQPSQTAGVVIAGEKMTLTSTANGAFVILIIRTGTVINVSCSRVAN